MTDSTTTLPLLPLRDVVVYPYMVIPLFVGRKESIAALEAAMNQNKQIFLAAQKDANLENPTADDIYQVGVIATILQMLHLHDGSVKVLVEGSQRALIKTCIENESNFLEVSIEEISDVVPKEDSEVKGLQSGLIKNFEKFIKLEKKTPAEIIVALRNIDDPARLADSIAAHMNIKIEDRQKILEEADVNKRLELVQLFVMEELDLVEVEAKIQGRVKSQVEKNQRQYYLSEKIKAIQNELGDLEDAPVDDLDAMAEKIDKVGMTVEAKEKAHSELTKLRMMPPMSAEATVSRNYLEALTQFPWKKKSKISKDMKKAEMILEGDHYGLEKVKERILEYLAVQKRVKKLKGAILCLVGPPGVGKTSLGESIANATGRRFVRMSLGGVRDEAEIRGHRRTYIGAMPGKVIQKVTKTEVRNPLFMLDEVDKMAMDFRGDPASALLEVLDPAQNNSFNDHYMEVDTDLSDVMFIATSNSLNIPPALLDRMEVIRLAGYTEDEKLNIAIKYLLPRQIKESGLNDDEVKITDGAIRDIIRYYTREAGVRNLEREISKLCRKIVREIDMKSVEHIHITQRNLEKFLGIKRHRFGVADEENRIGQVTGLAWTEVGGELLSIEAQIVPGKGRSIQTGRLGDVMQESIQAAMTVVRSRAKSIGIKDELFQQKDFHIHVPEGATPKDGPSAGVSMCTALVSALTKIPVFSDVAMTGEITLRGEVLPIGGLKEKLLAAIRGGIKNVLIPEENKRELKEIPKNVLEALNIYPVRWIDQVFELALETRPEPLSDELAVEEAVVDKSQKKKKPQRSRKH